MSLTHHELNSKKNALDSFLQISDQLPYLIGQHSDLPSLPRQFTNRLWRHYLDQLANHRQDPDFFNLLIATAEKLNRSQDVELYQSYKEKLIASKTTED